MEPNQGNPGEQADRLVRAALEARTTARDATGTEKTELLVQATLDATLATFFELRRVNIGTEEYVAALRKHSAWLEEHHGALGSHGRALQTQAQRWTGTPVRCTSSSGRAGEWSAEGVPRLMAVLDDFLELVAAR